MIKTTSNILITLCFTTTALVVFTNIAILRFHYISIILLFGLLLFSNKLFFYKKITLFVLFYTLINIGQHLFYNTGVPLMEWAESVVGITIYSATLGSYFNNTPLEESATLYLNIAYWTAVIALLQEVGYIFDLNYLYNMNWLFNGQAFPGTVSDILIRVNSVFTEPGYFAAFLSPALYISLETLFKRQPILSCSYFRAIIIITAYILTFSTLGYAGLLLSLSIVLRKHLLLLITTAIPLIYIAYTFLEMFSLRVDGLTTAYSDNTTNLNHLSYSSVVVYLNSLIVSDAIKYNPFLGMGFSSYEQNAVMYIQENFPEMLLASDSSIKDVDNLMLADGSNLIFRVIVEFGLLGLIFFLWNLSKSMLNISYNNWQKKIQIMCLVFMFTYSLRAGQYVRFELWFFILLLYNAKNNEQKILFS